MNRPSPVLPSDCPNRPLDTTPSEQFPLSVIFYALVAADCPGWAIDLWPSHEAAEAALREVLADELGFRDLLSVIPVNVSGTESEASVN